MLDKLEKFLNEVEDGEHKLSRRIEEEFTEACLESLRRQVTPPERSFSIRASSIGRPICQQQLEKLDTKRERNGTYFPVKMLYGDVSEAIVIALLRASGITIDSVHGEVELEVGGHTLTGTYDIVIDGAVYDIKSASPYAFEHKFSKGFKYLDRDDPFGYVSQLFIYAKAGGYKPGGWIVMNKVTGDIIVCEVPKDYKAIMHRVTNNIMDAIDILGHTESKKELQRCFDLVDETFYKEKTGKKILGMNCSYCPFKHECWDNKLVTGVNPMSKAKSPKPRLEYNEDACNKDT